MIVICDEFRFRYYCKTFFVLNVIFVKIEIKWRIVAGMNFGLGVSTFCLVVVLSNLVFFCSRFFVCCFDLVGIIDELIGECV